MATRRRCYNEALMKRALVVDDDPSLLALITEWLTAAGYAVESAGDFATAKQRLSGRQDLLVVDVRLKAFNGLQLAILARAGDAAMRIVVMTGWDDPVLRTEATSIGAVFLPKPFDEQQLLRVVEE